MGAGATGFGMKSTMGRSKKKKVMKVKKKGKKGKGADTIRGGRSFRDTFN